jgi:hypothetical protein
MRLRTSGSGVVVSDKKMKTMGCVGAGCDVML